MGHRPLGGVEALVRPGRGGMPCAVGLFEGMLPLAEKYNLAIAGGDTNSWDGPLVISITLIGQVTPDGPLLRGGARPGDRILVTGAFGGSILGRQFDFEPRVSEALILNERYKLHAGIDVSDGLSVDLAHPPEVVAPQVHHHPVLRPIPPGLIPFGPRPPLPPLAGPMF